MVWKRQKKSLAGYECFTLALINGIVASISLALFLFIIAGLAMEPIPGSYMPPGLGAFVLFLVSVFFIASFNLICLSVELFRKCLQTDTEKFEEALEENDLALQDLKEVTKNLLFERDRILVSLHQLSQGKTGSSRLHFFQDVVSAPKEVIIQDVERGSIKSY